MKQIKILIAIPILVIAGSLVNAGDIHHDQHRKLSEKRIEKMQQQLDLSDDQVTQLQGISEKYKQQRESMEFPTKTMKALHNLDPNSADYEKQLQQLADKAAKNTEARVLQKGHMRADIHKVLSTEQQEKMHQRMKEKHQRAKEKRKKCKSDKHQQLKHSI